MDAQEVKVLVPTERVTEFYRWFADWRDGVLPADSGAGVPTPVTPPVDADAQLAAAARWWRSLKPRERGIWGLWVEAAPKLLTADQIVSQLDLKGPRDIPGILSWSNRKGVKAGFRVDWRFEYDAVTGEPLYGLSPVDDLTAVEYADLLRRARAEAEA